MDDSQPEGQAKRCARIDDEAQTWLVRLNSGEDAAEDRRDFATWLAASPQHREAFERLNRQWDMLALVPDIDAVLERVTAPGKQAAPTRARQPGIFALFAPRRRVLAGAALAAASLAAVAFGLIGFVDRGTHTDQFVTAVGEFRTVSLPDGTRVEIRADSRLTATFSRNARRVEILRGGAFFDVASQDGRVFEVIAANTGVRVAGTAFDVLKGPNRIVVSVAEGRVIVNDRARPPAGAGAPRTVRLTQGRQVSAGLDGALFPARGFDPEQALAWRDGRLSYRQARLDVIIADINRHRARKVSIADPSLKALLITASFRIENSEEFLRGLEATEAIAVQMAPDGGVILARRAE